MDNYHIVIINLHIIKKELVIQLIKCIIKSMDKSLHSYWKRVRTSGEGIKTTTVLSLYDCNTSKRPPSRIVGDQWGEATHEVKDGKAEIVKIVTHSSINSQAASPQINRKALKTQKEY